MKPTLLVLAAGMGSRYGGVKQIDGVGLHDECLLDFATYDANFLIVLPVTVMQNMYSSSTKVF